MPSSRSDPWAIADGVAFDALAADRARSDPMLTEVWEHLGVKGSWGRPARGSALVAVGERQVLKLMAPFDAALADNEARCLASLSLPIRTPELLDHGSFRGWPWILMSRLAGRELADVWPSLSLQGREQVAEQLGQALAVLHASAPPAGLPRLDWADWLAQKLPALTEKHADAPPALLDGLQSWVEAQDLHEGPRAWLHTEIMREHLLVDGSGQLTGLFDFEPSWVGPRDYEYASVGLFVTAGDPALFGRLQRAAAVELEPRRLLAMALLHRYGGLGWYHRRLGGPLDLDVLAERWFGT